MNGLGKKNDVTSDNLATRQNEEIILTHIVVGLGLHHQPYPLSF